MSGKRSNTAHMNELSSFARLLSDHPELQNTYVDIGQALAGLSIPEPKNKPNDWVRPKAMFSHLFGMATEVVKEHLQEGDAKISRKEILDYISQNGLPPLPENAFEKGYSLKVDKAEVTLDAKQARDFYALMEPLASSYAAHYQAFFEQQQVDRTKGDATQYLEGRWNQFVQAQTEAKQAGLEPASELLKSRIKDLQQQLTTFTNALHFPAQGKQPEIQLRPQDAFAILAKVAGENGRSRVGFLGIKPDSNHEPDYSTFMRAVAKAGKLPYLSSDDFKDVAIEHNGVAFTPAQLETIYKEAATIAPAYAQWHKGLLDKAIAHDAAQGATLTVEHKEESVDAIVDSVDEKEHSPAAQAGDTPPQATDEEKKQQGNDAGAGKSGVNEKEDKSGDKAEKTTPQKITKFLFDTTKGKITVAAAAVAVVSMVMAMMLGGKSNKPQQVAGR